MLSLLRLQLLFFSLSAFGNSFEPLARFLNTNDWNELASLASTLCELDGGDPETMGIRVMRTQAATKIRILLSDYKNHRKSPYAFHDLLLHWGQAGVNEQIQIAERLTKEKTTKFYRAVELLERFPTWEPYTLRQLVAAIRVNGWGVDISFVATRALLGRMRTNPELVDQLKNEDVWNDLLQRVSLLRGELIRRTSTSSTRISDRAKYDNFLEELEPLLEILGSLTSEAESEFNDLSETDVVKLLLSLNRLSQLEALRVDTLRKLNSLALKSPSGAVREKAQKLVMHHSLRLIEAAAHNGYSSSIAECALSLALHPKL